MLICVDLKAVVRIPGVRSPSLAGLQVTIGGMHLQVSS